MSYKLVLKDAIRQILWRVISAICWFIVIKLITPYLWLLRYWDYSTILKYFAIWSALADFWLYVIAVRTLWKTKDILEKNKKNSDEYKKHFSILKEQFWKFVWVRLFTIIIVYTTAILLAYLLPAYTSNIYLIRWLPIWMMFSVSFMFAWVIQLPLQIFWKMEQVSIALIFARISQLIMLIVIIYILYPNINFNINSTNSTIAFNLILLSVLASWITQWIFVYFKSKKILPLKIKFDKKFTKDFMKKNWKYWLSYYLSSFHTLIVLIFLSIFFPTAKWYTYTWIWALSLALLEIMLIIPSALWNSLLHKISNFSKTDKKKSFWNFFALIFFIWMILFANFFVFNNEIIKIIGSKQYLWTNLKNIWSNIILPYLAIVLVFSFIKQVFNYIFVSNYKQNYLLFINLFWVVIWITVWFFLIPKFNIVWWIITQTLLEMLFVFGALFIAIKHDMFPKINIKYIFYIFLWILSTALMFKYLNTHFNLLKNNIEFIIEWFIINTFFVAIYYKIIKKIMKWLTLE